MVEGTEKYMASPQCLEGTGKKVTHKMCFPSTSEVLRLVIFIVKNIFHRQFLDVSNDVE